MAGVFPASAHATNDPENGLLRQTVLGPFLLDRGPSSDRHERGASIPTWNFNSRRRGTIGVGPVRRHRWSVLRPTLMADRSSWYGLADEFRLSTKRADMPAGGLVKNLFVSGASARCWTMGGCTKTGSAAMNEVIAVLTIAHFRVRTSNRELTSRGTQPVAFL